MSNHMGTSMYTDQLDIGAFDFFIIYDQDGNIARVLALKR